MSDVDSHGNLHTEKGARLPRLEIVPARFIDKTVALYGPSKTGKTVIIKNILKELSDSIEQVLVIAPSEPSNRSYEGFVDPQFIHYRLYMADPANPKKDDGAKGGLRFLDAVWNRQEMMAAIYTRANEPDVLAKLYDRLPRSAKSEGQSYIDMIIDKKAKATDRVQRQYALDSGKQAAKVKEVDDNFKKMLVLLYKKFITPHYEDLWAMDSLTENEKYSLIYLTFNPRLLLIFDDCAAQLKPYFNKEVFRKLFYQNRHSFITVVICCQDDTDLPANLRKNAFISFFTEPIICVSNFERTSNQFSKPTKAFVGDVAPVVFRGNRKLAYIREDDSRQHFYHVEFPFPKPFRFGSSASHELCDSVQSEEVSMDKENPFYDKFRF